MTHHGDVSTDVLPPIDYHHTEAFASLHLADYVTAAAALPSEEIRPVRWRGRHALVAVSAFRYESASYRRADGSVARLGRYGEVAVSVQVRRRDTSQAVGLLTAPRCGYVLHLPVTTGEACRAGRRLWGFPKFVADMDFVEEPEARTVDLSENGQRILRLEVHPRGPVVQNKWPLISYSVKDDGLVETRVPTRGHLQLRFGRRAGHLDLGDHPVAERLRILGIDPQPQAIFSYLGLRSTLPAGTRVALSRPVDSYAGTMRELGRLTVQRPPLEAVDEYAVTEPLHHDTGHP